MIANLWQSITDTVYSILQSIINILPDSPFEYLSQIPEVYQIMKWVNWFVPVKFMLSSMTAWLSAITIYYIYSVIMRWIKAID